MMNRAWTEFVRFYNVYGLQGRVMAKVVPEVEVERRRRVPPWSLTIWLLRQSPYAAPAGFGGDEGLEQGVADTGVHAAARCRPR